MIRTGADALREEGKLETKRDMVSRLVQSRFPQNIDDEIAASIQNEQNLQVLDKYFDALLGPTTWDDFAKMCEKAHLN